MFGIEIGRQGASRKLVEVCFAFLLVSLLAVLLAQQPANAQDGQFDDLSVPLSVPPSSAPPLPVNPPVDPPANPPVTPLTPEELIAKDIKEADTCLRANATTMTESLKTMKMLRDNALRDHGIINLKTALDAAGAGNTVFDDYLAAFKKLNAGDVAFVDNLWRPETAKAQQEQARLSADISEKLFQQLRASRAAVEARGRATQDVGERNQLALYSRLLSDVVLLVDDFTDAAEAYGRCRGLIEELIAPAPPVVPAPEQEAPAPGNVEQFEKVHNDLRFWVESRKALNTYIQSANTEIRNLQRAESSYSQFASNDDNTSELYAAMFRFRANEAAEAGAQLRATRSELIELAESLGARDAYGRTGAELQLGIERLAELEALGALPLTGLVSHRGGLDMAPNPWAPQVHLTERNDVDEWTTHVTWWVRSRTFDPGFTDADSLNSALELVEKISDGSIAVTPGGLIAGTETEPPQLSSSPAASEQCVDVPLRRIRVSGRTVTFIFNRLDGGFHNDALVGVTMTNKDSGERLRTGKTSGNTVSMRLMPASDYDYRVSTQCPDGSFGSSHLASKGTLTTQS